MRRSPRSSPASHLAMIFEASSTRTRVSFENGFAELGGNALYLRPGEIHLPGRESVADTAAVLSRSTTTPSRSARRRTRPSNELARHVDRAGINGMDNDRHPAQSMSDALTILEQRGHARGRHVRLRRRRRPPLQLAVDHAHQARAQRPRRQRRRLRDGARAAGDRQEARRRERRLVPAHQRPAGGHRRRRLHLHRLLVVDRPGGRVRGPHQGVHAVPGQRRPDGATPSPARSSCTACPPCVAKRSPTRSPTVRSVDHLPAGREPHALPEGADARPDRHRRAAGRPAHAAHRPRRCCRSDVGVPRRERRMVFSKTHLRRRRCSACVDDPVLGVSDPRRRHDRLLGGMGVQGLDVLDRPRSCCSSSRTAS